MWSHQTCTRPAASATELRPRIRNGRTLGPPDSRCPRVRTSREKAPDETAVADWLGTRGSIFPVAASRRPGQALENRPSARPLLLLLSLRAAWHVAPRWTIVSKDPSDRVDAPSSSVVAISSAGEVAPQTRRRRRASTLAAQHKRCGRSNVTGRACCGRRNALRGRASATILGSK